MRVKYFREAKNINPFHMWSFSFCWLNRELAANGVLQHWQKKYYYDIFIVMNLNFDQDVEFDDVSVFVCMHNNILFYLYIFICI